METYILLAEDDLDDCLFFRESLEALQLPIQLTEVHDGEALLDLLSNDNHILPDVIFMDLNMPRKNGFQCLKELKQDERLKRIPVVIISTGYDGDTAQKLYQSGASYYIQKPNQLSKLQILIALALKHITSNQKIQPLKENFLIQ